jgi:hypothetical protein
MSFTFVHDMSSGRTYTGNYHASSSETAHERLARKAGLDVSQCIGGYYNPSASDQRFGGMVMRSESINQGNFNVCDWTDSSSGYAPPNGFLGSAYSFRNGGGGWQRCW